jgi:23S rRNA-/tRNA-specific pseudouridylate synthase
VGDGKYGAKQTFKLRDLALHAYSLTLLHPVTNKEVPLRLELGLAQVELGLVLRQVMG